MVVDVIAFRPSSSFVRRQTDANACTRSHRQHLHHHVSKSLTLSTSVAVQHQGSRRDQALQRYTSSTLASSSNKNGSGVESLSLDVLGDNYEQVGDEIATSVQAMLDTEWMPQDIHYKMGQSVKQSYIKVRRSSTGDNDDMIMTIMTTVADDLIMNWKQYDKDAFVNAWDIANYVSDYLTTKINGDGCGCSSKIY